MTDSAKPFQLVGQFAQGLATMRDGILLVFAEFGPGFPKLGQQEIRVVAEAVLAARRVDDLAVPAPLGNEWLGVVGIAHQHHHAIVVGAAVGLALQGGDAHFVVARVGHRLAGVRASMTRLGQAVFNKRDVRLGAFWHAEIGLRRRFDCERFEDARNFAQLARIARGDDQFLHDASAFCWAAVIWPMPAVARSSKASSVARENGVPSAVPCTSTMPPLPVITTFMSVSQSESSR